MAYNNRIPNKLYSILNSLTCCSIEVSNARARITKSKSDTYIYIFTETHDRHSAFSEFNFVASTNVVNEQLIYFYSWAMKQWSYSYQLLRYATVCLCEWNENFWRKISTYFIQIITTFFNFQCEKILLLQIVFYEYLWFGSNPDDIRHTQVFRDIITSKIMVSSFWWSIALTAIYYDFQYFS